MFRRQFMMWSAAALVVNALPVAAAVPEIVVFKSPTCGCCEDWITHLRASGFTVKVNDVGNAAARRRLGIPQQLGSCHTGEVGGYAVEGHVPAREILRLLQERPAAAGVAVPGMPTGSPGMDGLAYGNRRDPYDVLLVARDGSTRVFQSYR